MLIQPVIRIASIASISLLLIAQAAPADDVTITLDSGFGFVVEDNSSTVDRLRIDEATGNISRNGALFVHTTGTNNTFVGSNAGGAATINVNESAAFGRNALAASTAGDRNSAFGFQALQSNTTGSSNSAFGRNALRDNTTASFNSAFGVGALTLNTLGIENTAVGFLSLNVNLAGSGNAAFGTYAMSQNASGDANAAFGSSALASNADGLANSAFGWRSLVLNTSGGNNVAVGHSSLSGNTTGDSNTALGTNALPSNATGARNVAIGFNAGSAQTSGSDNIYIGSPGANESGVIRIGTIGTQSFTFIGSTFPAQIGSTVVVNPATGLLGTPAPSSVRFKESVRDMADSSRLIMNLRPVTFQYRDGVVLNDDEAVHYGLIAEEVAELEPALVHFDEGGVPYSVAYEALVPMLLNEMQKQQRTIESQKQVIAAFADRLGEVEQRLATAGAETGR